MKTNKFSRVARYKIKYTKISCISRPVTIRNKSYIALSFCNILTSSLDLRVCGSNSPSRAKCWTAQLRYRLLTDSCALRWVALRASALCEGVRRAPRTTHSGAGALQRETPPQRKPCIRARRPDESPCCNEDPVQPKTNKMV